VDAGDDPSGPRIDGHEAVAWAVGVGRLEPQAPIDDGRRADCDGSRRASSAESRPPDGVPRDGVGAHRVAIPDDERVGGLLTLAAAGLGAFVGRASARPGRASA
jgi:hypothetical protein